jgi:hypothetical protein
MGQAIVFVSICPRCKRERAQDALTIADLVRLLNGGYPIEAYCGSCDEFWPISLQKRIELGEVVAAAGVRVFPLSGFDQRVEHPSAD